MKSNHSLLLTIFILVLALSSVHAQSPDKTAVTEVIRKYELALETKDIKTCTDMFADKGVLISYTRPVLKGNDIMKYYKNTFEAWQSLQLDMNFEEIEVHDDWAYVRTDNIGTVVRNGASAKLESTSSFLLVKQADGAWKVKSYTVNGPANN